MADDFDPYRKWLGVTGGDRPPTHYQLLGVSPTEEDPEVISGAVIRQSAYVRNFQAGKFSDHATRVLNELSAAKICLLDPVKRAQYDAELKRRQAAAAPQQPAATQRPATPRPAAQPAAPRAPAARPAQQPAKAARPAPRNAASPLDDLLGPIAPTAAPLAAGPLMLRRKSDRGQQMALAGGGLLLVIGLFLLAMFVFKGDSPPPGGLAAGPATGTDAPTSPSAQPFVANLAPAGGNTATVPPVQPTQPSVPPFSRPTSPSTGAIAGSTNSAGSEFDDPFAEGADEPAASSGAGDSSDAAGEDDASPFVPIEKSKVDVNKDDEPKLERSTAKLPSLKFNEDSLSPVGEASDRGGSTFVEQAPERGWLVGLKVTKGPAYSKGIESVTPIYQVGDSYKMGRLCGASGSGEGTRLLAKPGYAVGGMRVRAGSVVNSFQLVFYRVAGQRLDPSDSHNSVWFGDEGGERLPDIECQGDPIVGISGGYASSLVNLQLLRVMALPKPEQPLAPFNGVTVESDAAGFARGSSFADKAPQGGLLVGLRVFQGKSWGGAVRAVQPIYQVGDRYVLGERHGGEGGVPHQLLARSGYAVGGIWVRSGLIVDSIKLAYYRVGGRRLIVKDLEESDLVGIAGGRPVALDGGGRPVVGIFGTFEDDLNSLGFQALR